jgi:ankyrin repeat protein
MQLINVKTLKLEKFLDNNLPPYAILSHTWKDDEELTFRDIKEGRTDKPGIGSIKLQRCCKQAEKDGLGHIWIDTCCIDKSDSVELGEAINSMFRWYKKANICYAYLIDVPGDDNPRNLKSEFQKSRWFKRGWTLQELLAPQRLQFYSSDWRCLGTKGDMCNILETITGISYQFLLGIEQLRNASVAQRMSWAAQRETTREEDIAYCLLGIFGVTIPMIYGEGGEQAFFRLQEQIMRTTRDDSILAWGLSLTDPTSGYATEVIPGRILAVSPSDFANCKHIISREQSSTPIHSLDISGGSLRIYLSLLTTSAGETIGLLKCGPEDEVQMAVGIPLSNAKSTSPDEYIRPRGSHSVLLPMVVANTSPKLIHIKNVSQNEISMDANQRYWLYGDGFAETNLDLIDVSPQSCWDKERALIVSTIESDSSTTCRTLARFRYTEEESRDFVIVLEMEQQESCVEPQCYVMTCSRDTSLEDLAEIIRYMSRKVSGGRSASNGTLSMHVTCESVARQRIILIRPHVTSNSPDVTSDATLELRKLDLRLQFAKIMEEEWQTDIEDQELEQKLKEESTRLEQTKRELGVVEDELRGLTEKRGILVECKENAGQEIVRLNARQTEVETKQKDIIKRHAYTQGIWDGIRHIYHGGCESEEMDFQTLLRWAAEHGHEVIMKQLLIISNVNVDSKDNEFGRTPLSLAAIYGHPSVVQLLLTTGQVDPNSKSNSGRTPLSYAAINRHPSVVQLLLTTGQVDPNSKSNSGRTPLSYAAENGCEAIVQLLLFTIDQVDADPKSNSGRTPLSYAAANGRETIVQLLLATGQVDADSKNNIRRTPLSYAAENGREAIVQLLLATGKVNPDSYNKYGQTPQTFATMNGHDAIVQLLLAAGELDTYSESNSS